MPPDRFEALIGELLIQMGFDESTVTVTRHSGDGGIDVTGVYRAAGLTEVSAAVQAKRWKANVQAPVGDLPARLVAGAPARDHHHHQRLLQGRPGEAAPPTRPISA